MNSQKNLKIETERFKYFAVLINSMEKNNKCKVDYCNRLQYAKNYCKRHYQQIQVNGKIKRNYIDKNEIVKYKNYAKIYLYNIKGKKIAEAKIDLEDMPLISKYHWSFKDGYAVSNKCKKTFLHNLILNTPKNLECDHINRDRSDNRRKNLRIVTRLENLQNKSIYKNNKSGVAGVCFLKTIKRWQVEVCYKKKTYYLGRFKTKKEAIEKINLYKEKIRGKK